MIFRYWIVRGSRISRIIPGILPSPPTFSRASLSLSYPTTRTLATAVLPQPSNAQTQAIKILQTSRDNILVNACAGSGKTTTILQLAAAMQSHNFLILVYNNRLMIETNERIESLGLENAVVYNYHTLGHRFYSPECDTDQGLKRIVRDKLSVMRGKKLPPCDVLVLDEQQDMTPILKVFIDRVVQDIEDMKNQKTPKSNKKGVGEQEGGADDIDPSQTLSGTEKRPSRIRRVLLGDPQQELYEFNDADRRFLTLAQSEELFGNREDWETIKQNISYRLTKPNAEFINKQMLKPEQGEEIVSIKDKAPDGSAFPRPRYVFFKPLGDHDSIVDHEPYKEVQRLLKKMGYPDILVLAPSLKSDDVINLANCLALKGHPVQVPDFEDSQGVSLSQSRGKITICTYHQSKGIEREAAVLCGFDLSYHIYYNKTPEKQNVAGNPQYVAATRAKTDLVILNRCDCNYLPFLDPKTLGDTCEIVNPDIHHFPLKKEVKKEEKEKEEEAIIMRAAVTTLTRNIHQREISECIQELELEQISPAFHGSSPPSEIDVGRGLVESVANITGTAVPAMYEYYLYTTGRKRVPALSSFADLFRHFKEYNDGKRCRNGSQCRNGKQCRNRKGCRKLGLFARIQYDRPEINDHLRFVEQKMNVGQLDDGDILFLANFSVAIESTLLVKLLSIPLDRYTWVEEKHRKNINRILSYHIPLGCRFERNTRQTFHGSQFTPQIDVDEARISGRLDISVLKKKLVFEVKYTQKFRDEHILQLALYAALVEKKCGKGSTSKLINAMSGQVIQVKPKTESSYENILGRLIGGKVKQSRTLVSSLTHEDFIKEAGNAFENYIGPVVLPSWFNDPKIRRSSERHTR
ncbi:P-loop containing nucleoside triphosphate hydrolase protein [Choiromyces venosus 120613-1]|uniref:P-loop containing nucleoside triphosphate hydrolase protein n=1 Tax=Choiromyces venosus 120613-1 TaxID=1336337 RepID=A0A3N4J8M5_9PEZI|nr:P-loop containing nucleoside triphosphate hydrolase protein [Choiromyces venosus 120613-1]